MNIDKITKAIEADAGKDLPGLAESLKESVAGQSLFVLPMILSVLTFLLY